MKGAPAHAINPSCTRRPGGVILEGVSKNLFAVLALLSLLAGCASSGQSEIEDLEKTLEVVSVLEQSSAKTTMRTTCIVLPPLATRWEESGKNVKVTAPENMANMKSIYGELNVAVSEELSRLEEIQEAQIRFSSDSNREVPFVDEFYFEVYDLSRAIVSATEDSLRFGYFEGYGGYFQERHVEELTALCDRLDTLE